MTPAVTFLVPQGLRAVCWLLLVAAFSRPGLAAETAPAPGPSATKPATSAPAPAPPTAASASSTNDLAASMEQVKQGNQAFREGDRERAIAMFAKALETCPTNVMALYNRGRVSDNLGRYTNPMADYNRLLTLSPKNIGATQLRGALHLRLGEFPAAIADFDRYCELSPKAEPRHWQRGLAYYLAGRYPDAQRQFTRCLQSNSNDVENAIWHFLSVAKTNGVEKARAALLPVGHDRRPLLNEVYDVYAGKLDADALLKKLEGVVAGHPEMEDSRFLVHYYLAQYFEVTGNAQRSLALLSQAAQLKSVDSIMTDLAKLQLKQRMAKPARPGAG
jgi:lipoprotein NlpI